MKCRHCHTELTHVFADLGEQPASNNYLDPAELNKPLVTYPLVTYVCHHCWLVQTQDFASADTFFSADYAYFSSTSSSWLAHARRYSEQMIQYLGLNSDSLVVEVASNDGYLLKNFVEKKIPCLGIEPTASTAAASEKLGVRVIQEFFGQQLADELVSGVEKFKDLKLHKNKADLIAGNNVLAHVPDINDFVAGVSSLLAERGTATFEFPHLQQLIQQAQFDTIYHEHFSYLSLTAVTAVFLAAGLAIYKVEELETHGGSLRIYACHKAAQDHLATHQDTLSVNQVLENEDNTGLTQLDVYQRFQNKIDAITGGLTDFLKQAQHQKKRVAGYGAAAKANTLLNTAGIDASLLPVIYDAAASKQGKYMPGSSIAIANLDTLQASPPDIIIIFPWNIQKEIVSQLQQMSLGDCEGYVALPEMSRVF